MAKNVKNNWKTIPIDTNSFSKEDFESFGGIEELADYEIIKPSKKRKGDEHEQVFKEKKKRKKVHKIENVTTCIDGNEETVKEDEENPTELPSEDIDLSAWCNLFVPEEILKALGDLGFEKPTKIQELVLPAATRDHQDILAAAETGSGKTLAFGIPMITHIKLKKELKKCKNAQDGSTLKGLVLAPTRELAIQVKNHLQAVSKYVNIKIVAVVGGMSLEKQRRLLQKCPDIIVATPGRLWQLMEEGEPYLEQVPFVRYLVIDEADRMLEKGHFEELEKILELLNENKETKRRQSFVFSATLTLIHDLPKRLLLKKKKHKVDPNNKLGSLMQAIGVREKAKVIDITRKAGVVETLSESRIPCKLEEKDLYLYYFKVMYPGRTLVFCNSISSVRRLKSVLKHLGCAPLALHASMQQRQRLKNLDTFADSQNGLLLATDVASRGLDIKNIEHVVHFQVPRTAEIYIHRSGRTARAQNEGLSLMLVEPQEGVFYRRICKTLNKDQNLPLFPIDHEILKVIKNRVSTARQVDLLEHRQKRVASQNQWFLKAAEEMEIDVEDEKLLTDLGTNREQSVRNQQIKALKKQLQNMLQKPLIPKTFTGSYPTKLGKLLAPTKLGSEKAVKVLKNFTSSSNERRKKKNKHK